MPLNRSKIFIMLPIYFTLINGDRWDRSIQLHEHEEFIYVRIKINQ